MDEVITSRKNEKIIHLKKLGNSHSYRKETGEFLCDGEKLLQEAVKHNIKIKIVLKNGEIDTKIPDGVMVFSVSQDIIEAVSPLQSAQNVLFSCEIPQKPDIQSIKGNSIILESVQDPGNLGSIIRTASAFEVENIVLVGACADPYNPKTIRAAMGGVFRQKIIKMTYEEIKIITDEGLKIYGAALDKDSVDLREADLKGVAVAIGSEGKGLSDRFLEMCDKKIIIPMNPECESLNAGIAAAVILWEMKGKLAKQK